MLLTLYVGLKRVLKKTRVLDSRIVKYYSNSTRQTLWKSWGSRDEKLWQKLQNFDRPRMSWVIFRLNIFEIQVVLDQIWPILVNLINNYSFKYKKFAACHKYIQIKQKFCVTILVWNIRVLARDLWWILESNFRYWLITHSIRISNTQTRSSMKILNSFEPYWYWNLKLEKLETKVLTSSWINSTKYFFRCRMQCSAVKMWFLVTKTPVHRLM